MGPQIWGISQFSPTKTIFSTFLDVLNVFERKKISIAGHPIAGAGFLVSRNRIFERLSHGRLASYLRYF